MKLNFNGRNGIGMNSNFLNHLGSMKYPHSIFDAQEKSLSGNENNAKKTKKSEPRGGERQLLKMSYFSYM